MRITILMSILCLALSACNESETSWGPKAWQEPVVAWTRSRDGNPVAFGASVPPERRAEIVASIASATRGRLPGVRFYVVQYPALYGEARVHSYRTHGTKARIVLSWWTEPDGRFVCGDIPWEVEHLVAGTDDKGRLISPLF